MFIFHEGLPRSGKSFEAVVERIVPALLSGRKVYARLNGINHEKIAEASGLPVERVKELLFEIPEIDVLRWADIVENDSLVILDEMQNFWPHGTARSIDQSQIKAIAEHGHRGLDIVGMGQLLKGAGGVHANWVNRCDQKIVFEKQNGLGRDDKYRWTAYKGMHDGKGIKFVQTSTGVKKYDPKYFGTYATRVSDSANASTYQDARTNIWNNSAFRKWIPLFVIVVCVAVWYVYGVFKGGGLANSINKTHGTATPTLSVSSFAPVASSVAASSAPVAPPVEKKYEKDFIQDLSERYRLRVSAIVQMGGRTAAVFEWFDDGLRAVERLSLAQVERLGYKVVVSPGLDGATIEKGKVMYVATQFPLEGWARVSDARQRDIAGGDRGDARGAPAQPQGGGGGSVVSFDEDGYGVLGKHTGRPAGAK